MVVLTRSAGHGLLAGRSDSESHLIPARPGKAELDPLLTDLAGKRLVVFGTDADLAAVVLRLLRTDRLGSTPVGYVPLEPDSEVAALWGIPVEHAVALELAATGMPSAVPLIRDDSGGVLIGAGVISPVRGVGYCDETRVLRGQARRLRVMPDSSGGPGLVVEVTQRSLLSRRISTACGRALQLGCLPAVPRCDGVPHPRPVTRWTWYRHTEDLPLIRSVS